MARICGIKIRSYYAFLLVTSMLVAYAVIYYKNVKPSNKFEPTIKPKRITLPSRETIPKVIHQIWSGDVIPEEFVGHVRSIIKYNPHPEWEYYFWTLDLGREFIIRKFPKLLKIYDHAKRINKAEILRMAVVYYYGGAYFDLDVFGLRPLDRFVENHGCALVAPVPEFFVAYHKVIDRFEVNNAIFLCRRNHPFFKELISRKEMLSVTCFLQNDSKSCNIIEFAQPLLAKYAATGNTSILPEVVDYYLFDSLYDPSISGLLEEFCIGEEYLKLEPAKQSICDNWVKLGKGNRKVHEDAYTYHSWYHTKTYPVTIDPKNKISHIVPHAKMYNPAIDRHAVIT